ncbi:hypothetical protein [Actinokineospora globicatena]|uniref:Uncharacterized protein n=1 Tax=Actinokineospora globicatena TaxID=103729 RepID=A0A9W6QMD6_9PSEU|nr:hypothetical protein [Actinokineospora globicatena]MCP2301385.1 hypothetical protein [Actinokineospora globicatena]GLW76976.1 hypothetical protein Aglo01_14580 [Actinokineospora globicatena]GLW83810.1 hypothetical protein Aglo02_14500 [Actinokineospora globicatena]GLW92247.1 hypothetical protein Aglo03_30630 [Actinokineospora globicatena]
MSDDLGLTGDLDTSVPEDKRHRAARVVAAIATDAAECAMLLDMLGLTPEVGAKRDHHRAA